MSGLGKFEGLLFEFHLGFERGDFGVVAEGIEEGGAAVFVGAGRGGLCVFCRWGRCGR